MSRAEPRAHVRARGAEVSDLRRREQVGLTREEHILSLHVPVDDRRPLRMQVREASAARQGDL